jgi:hypothetical protein
MTPARTAEADSEWNAWCEAHVRRGLDAHSAVLIESIGEVLAEERLSHRAEREQALAPLRCELAELQGQVKVLLTLLQGAKAADVVALPGARKPNAS